MYRFFFKKFIDMVFALLLIILVSPILLITTLLLLIYNRGMPFFLQRRPGKNGRIFTILKFKTMNDKKDISGKLLPDNQRLTKVGSFVRKISIDELPQLFNVVKGDMSLVGPRPLLPEYLPLYNEFQMKRHNVKPGITGWAQVNGRNEISWKEKFDLDVWYVENVRLKTDLYILIRTLKKVFKKEGISQKGRATTDFFNGKN
jgi:lipopolysaccharide/colanic/teichoic acid biosynthesis glycosyltransferase